MKEIPPPTPEDLLRPDEVAKLWRMSAKTVRALCRTGTLSHIRVTDRGLRIRRGEAEAYLAARMKSGSAM